MTSSASNVAKALAGNPASCVGLPWAHSASMAAGGLSHSRGASHVVRADVDYYSVLGVDKSADKKEIKQAYRYCLISALFQSHVNAYGSMHKVS